MNNRPVLYISESLAALEVADGDVETLKAAASTAQKRHSLTVINNTASGGADAWVTASGDDPDETTGLGVRLAPGAAFTWAPGVPQGAVKAKAVGGDALVCVLYAEA